jgi:putative Holliday junction resolvase
MTATRILGIDHGQSRIGVAVSDELRLLAHPCETIVIAANRLPTQRVAQIARDKQVGEIIVGLPRHLNGTLGAAAQEVLEFAADLRTLVSCEVRMWDERLTTVAAHRALRDAGKNTRSSRGYIDQVAAQIMLQSYLDSLAAREADPSEPSEFEEENSAN